MKKARRHREMEENSTQTLEPSADVSIPPGVRPSNEAEVSLDEMLSLACRQGKQDIVELLLESGANVNHRNKAGNTPLLEACSQGHVVIAQMLLDHGADIDAPTEPTSDSALTWACTLGNDSIVDLLLNRKANVEHRTKDGCTALMFAALAGHVKVTRLLLDNKAMINVESDSNKDSPLTFACWKGHKKVVQLLLEHSANLEHRTKEGFTPLMFAALGGHTDVADLLLERRAAVNVPSGSNNDIPLTSACWKGHYDVVCLLLNFNSDIEHRTKDGCTPLMLAAREGHFNVAKLLLDKRAEVNVPSGSENNIPLTLACWKGHMEVVNLLLKHKSKIEHRNKAGCTPLMLAAREGHFEATSLLLEHEAQINVPSGSNDDTPLTLACWKGHTKVVQLLISKKSNIDHQTKTGCTPLMEATREGHVGVAKLLLDAGANVETPDNYGQSPLFMACWKGHSEVAELLLRCSANRDCRTKTGITPLFQACRENHVNVVKLLLDYGCSVNSPFPNSRECPITLAAEKGHTELVKLLLLRECNVESKTKKGCSPLYLACKEGHFDIVCILFNGGGNLEEADQRSITPLVAAFRNGHAEIVEWLLDHVSHLPSEAECHKSLMAPAGDKETLLPLRSKCLDMIMKARKAREQAALKNAQILCEELDAEKVKKENKKKNAAKKRDKRKEKKRIQKEEKQKTQEAPEDDYDDMESVENQPKSLSKKKQRSGKQASDGQQERQQEEDEEDEDSQPDDDMLFVDARSELLNEEDGKPPSPVENLRQATPSNETLPDKKRKILKKPNNVNSTEAEYEEENPEDIEWTKPNDMSSQGGTASDWSMEDLDDLILEQQTDDNKIKSQHALHEVRVTSSVAISTSATLTSVSSATSTRAESTSLSSSTFWQEVGRNKGSFSISVPNNLIGRVIGVKGSKINMITEISGAQIHVAKAQGKAAGRTITIRGTPKAISKARELIDEALGHADRDNSAEGVSAKEPLAASLLTSSAPQPPNQPISTSTQQNTSMSQKPPLAVPVHNSPVTICQVTSTTVTTVTTSNLRANPVANVADESSKRTTKNPWSTVPKPPGGTHRRSQSSNVHNTTVTFATTTTPTAAVATSSNTWKVRRAETSVTMKEKVKSSQIKDLPPHHSRPPQASTYSDVASGIKPKASPTPVSVCTSQPQQQPFSTPPTTPVAQPSPVPQASSPVPQPMPSPTPSLSHSMPAQSQAVTKVTPSLSLPMSSVKPSPTRQHQRSISDPTKIPPPPQLNPTQEEQLRTAISPPPLSPPLNQGHLSQHIAEIAEDVENLHPSPLMPSLADFGMGSSDSLLESLPVASAASPQDLHETLSSSSFLNLPPPPPKDSSQLGSKTGQFGAIGAHLPSSAVHGLPLTSQETSLHSMSSGNKEKRMSYAGLAIEEKNGSNHVYSPVPPATSSNIAASSKLNPLAPEFNLEKPIFSFMNSENNSQWAKYNSVGGDQKRPFAPPGWISADKSSVSTVGGAPGAGKATRSISLDVQYATQSHSKQNQQPSDSYNHPASQGLPSTSLGPSQPSMFSSLPPSLEFQYPPNKGNTVISSSSNAQLLSKEGNPSQQKSTSPKRKYSYPTMAYPVTTANSHPSLPPPTSPWSLQQPEQLDSASKNSSSHYQPEPPWGAPTWNKQDVWTNFITPPESLWGAGPQKNVSSAENSSPWPSWSTESDNHRGTSQATYDEREDLIQLLRSLDISEQHADALMERGLTVQQLHSMSDDEWRNIQLPMGPRLKLRRAVENMNTPLNIAQ